MNLETITSIYFDYRSIVVFRLIESIVLSSLIFYFIYWFVEVFVISEYPLINNLDSEAIEEEKEEKEDVILEVEESVLIEDDGTFQFITPSPPTLSPAVTKRVFDLRSNSYPSLLQVSRPTDTPIFINSDEEKEAYSSVEDDYNTDTFLDHLTFYKNLNNSSQYLRRDSFSQ